MFHHLKPRLNFSFPFRKQIDFWFGKEYSPSSNEILLNHARSGIVLALRMCLPHGGRVGVPVYDCHTVFRAVEISGCKPVFVDIDKNLRLNTDCLSMLKLDAIVVTNLFGIRNNINLIQRCLPDIPIIVDNAHGGGLPPEGDFTIYSINQGKFPVAGPGGILYVNSNKYKISFPISEYNIFKELMTFFSIVMKAMSHNILVYPFIARYLKNTRRHINIKEQIVVSTMPRGVQRVYCREKQNVKKMIGIQCANADNILSNALKINGVRRGWYGDNAFVLILECENVEFVKNFFLENYFIETETHFKQWLSWAEKFGYKKGLCSEAESLISHLLMVPTY